jgi:hypothetical protein
MPSFIITGVMLNKSLRLSTPGFPLLLYKGNNNNPLKGLSWGVNKLMHVKS